MLIVRKSPRWIPLAIAVFVRLLLGPAEAHAATLTVTTAADSGPGSLREAVLASTSGDVIVFDAALAAMTIHLTTTDSTHGLDAPFGPTAIVIDGLDVTIDGAAAPGLTIDVGATTQRILAVTGAGGSGAAPAATPGVLRLVNLTLSGGIALGGDGGIGNFDAVIGGGAGGGGAGMGGSVFVDRGSSLILVGVLVERGTAQGGAGGPIGMNPIGTAFGAGGGGLGGDGGDGGGSTGGVGGPPNGGATPPNGGFGGGGAGAAPAPPGFGGFGGGGGGAGAGRSSTFDAIGGAGGFGGGGGGNGSGSPFFAPSLGPPGGYGGGGGGIYFAGSQGGSGGGGAGLGGCIFVNGGTLEATGSTFTGCAAVGGASPFSAGAPGYPGQGLGGAIFALNAHVTLTFCTLVANRVSALAVVTEQAGGSLPRTTRYVTGGALDAVADAGTTRVTIRSSILFGSTNAGGPPYDIAATSLHGGSVDTTTDPGDGANIIGAQTGFLPAIAGASADPVLGPLGDHGGPTPTMELGAMSPARDAGNASITTLPPPMGAGGLDQRGFARRIGATDIGALETQPAIVTIDAGAVQTTAVGSAFPDTITLTVLDSFGDPLRGHRAQLTAPSTGPSATFAAATPSSDVSDVAGSIALAASANGVAGSYGVAIRFATSGLLLGNTAGPLAALRVVGGSGQRTLVSTAFAEPLVFRAADSFDNPLAGLTVSLTAPSSGASADLSATAVVTAADGTSSIGATANAVGGTYDVVAEVSGLTANATLTNRTPATVLVVLGNRQSTRVGTTFAEVIVLEVQDQDGAPLPGVTLTLTPPSTGASATFGSASLVSDAMGRASTAATANGVAGSYGTVVTAGGATALLELTNASPGLDGGVFDDAGVRPADAATDGGTHLVDAGTAGASSIGCGCASAGRARHGGGVLSAIAAIAIVVRRRRRAEVRRATESRRGKRHGDACSRRRRGSRPSAGRQQGTS